MRLAGFRSSFQPTVPRAGTAVTWVLRCGTWALLSVVGFSQVPGPPPGVMDRKPDSPPIHHRTDPRLKDFLITGQVLQEDETPAPQVMEVELFCNGRVSRRVQTSADGYFTFDLGQSADRSRIRSESTTGEVGGMIPSRWDADEMTSANERGRVNLGGCEVRLRREAGYRSNSIGLDNRSIFDDPYIGVLTLAPIVRSDEKTVDVDTLQGDQEPQDLLKRLEQRLQAEDSDRAEWEEIAGSLDALSAEEPEMRKAWQLLAEARLRLGRKEEARSALERALELGPGDSSLQWQLARLSWALQDWEATIRWTDDLLEEDADRFEALFWKGMSHYHRQEFAVAERAFRRLVKSGKIQHFSYCLLPLGVIHANQGKFGQAARELLAFLEWTPEAQVHPDQRLEIRRLLQRWQEEGKIRLAEEAQEP